MLFWPSAGVASQTETITLGELGIERRDFGDGVAHVPPNVRRLKGRRVALSGDTYIKFTNGARDGSVESHSDFRIIYAPFNDWAGAYVGVYCKATGNAVAPTTRQPLHVEGVLHITPQIDRRM